MLSNMNFSVFMTKGIHPLRGWKYRYREAWLNMTMAWKNMLPFTSVYKLNLDITFIYYIVLHLVLYIFFIFMTTLIYLTGMTNSI